MKWWDPTARFDAIHRPLLLYIFSHVSYFLIPLFPRALIPLKTFLSPFPLPRVLTPIPRLQLPLSLSLSLSLSSQEKNEFPKKSLSILSLTFNLY